MMLQTTRLTCGASAMMRSLMRIGNLRPLGHHDSGRIRHGQRLREGIVEEALVAAAEGVRGKNITRSCSHASEI